MLFTIILFIVVLAVLVLSHEFGHFYAARKSGVKVEEFGFGFPPRLFSYRKGETLYTFNLLPLGGFVRLEGEDQDAVGPRSFNAQSLGKQAVIVAAGVIANLLLAFVLFTIVHWIGSPVIVDPDTVPHEGIQDISVQIVDVEEGSPADLAGMRFGETILGLRNGNDALTEPTITEIQQFVEAQKGNEITITVMRAGEPKDIQLLPRTDPEPGQGAIGIAMLETALERAPWYKAPLLGLQTTIRATETIFRVFGLLIKSLFGGPEVPGGVTGPVGIAAAVGDTGRLGLSYLLNLVALISVNLGVLNILPIPALDGGRLLFILIEKIKGAPIASHIPRMAHTVGFLVLIGLLIVVTVIDIFRFF